MEITVASVSAAIGIVGVISGILVGWVGAARTGKKALIERTTADVQLRKDVEYIKRAVDDIRCDEKTASRCLDEHDTRITRCEESTASAHKRIDEIIRKEK